MWLDNRVVDCSVFVLEASCTDVLFSLCGVCGTGTEELKHVTLSKCVSTFNAHVCPLLGQNAKVSFLFEVYESNSNSHCHRVERAGAMVLRCCSDTSWSVDTDNSTEKHFLCCGSCAAGFHRFRGMRFMCECVLVASEWSRCRFRSTCVK